MIITYELYIHKRRTHSLVLSQMKATFLVCYAKGWQSTNE